MLLEFGVQGSAAEKQAHLSVAAWRLVVGEAEGAEDRMADADAVWIMAGFVSSLAP